MLKLLRWYVLNVVGSEAPGESDRLLRPLFPLNGIGEIMIVETAEKR